MTTAYERHLIVSYLANAAVRLRHRDRAASALVEWVMDREGGPGFPSRRLCSRLDRANIDPDERLTGSNWRAFRRALRDECAAATQPQPDLAARRLQHLAETTDLNRTDVAILELLLRYQTQPIIESMIDEVLLRSTLFKRFATRTLKGSIVPALLGVSASAIRDRLSDSAPLVRSGLVSVERDGDVTIVDRLRRLATVPGSVGLDASRLLLDAAPVSELEWSDFDHIAEGRDHIERLIQGALQTSAPGVNILLYGPPGTGKTEFCKVLAERLGVTLYSVGEADDDGDEPSRSERLQELRLAQRLLARNRGSLLLFDEMEDLLSGSVSSGLSLFGQPFLVGGQNGSSKVFMHRLLERAPTPTLWAMNDASSVSKAILRRMMFALELRPPTTAVRARIWTRQLEHHGIEAGPDEAHALAREFAATPGVAAGATAAVLQQDIALPSGGSDPIRHLAARLSAHAETAPQQVAVVRLLLLTGCRKSEILTLRWSDYREGHLFLRDSKTGPRTVWLSQPARNVLDGLDRTGQCVFPAARGRGPRNKGWLEGFWDTVRAEAGLRGVRLHDLRHTHASIALRQGETVLTIAKLLGHRNPETTLKYTHLADKTVMDAAETVGAALEA